MQKKSNKLICFGLVLFTIMTIGISSADSLDVELIGQIGGSDSAVAIAGNYTYTGQGQDLVVYDTTNADNPVELERITTSGFVYHIAVEDNYAYIAGNNGLTIFDISIPSSPVIAGNYSGYTENIEVLDNYAYINKDNSISIVNITNPSAPVLVGSYQSAHVSDIAVSGSYAYIISDIRPEDIDETGFTIIDISNPSAPIFKGYLEFSKSTYAIAVSGNYAYMASETGLMIIDITNPSTPTITNSYDTGWVGDIIVEGNYAYISNSIALSILDITDSSLPQLVGSYPIENVSCIAVENNYIYVVSESSGLSILHVNNVPSIDQTTTTSYAVNDDNRLRESSPSSVLSTSSYIDLGKSTSRCRDVMAFNLSGYENTFCS